MVEGNSFLFPSDDVAECGLFPAGLGVSVEWRGGETLNFWGKSMVLEGRLSGYKRHYFYPN